MFETLREDGEFALYRGRMDVELTHYSFGSSCLEVPRSGKLGAAGARRVFQCLAASQRKSCGAAGINCGAQEHYVAVPPDRVSAGQPTACRFRALTEGLDAVVDWLKDCRVTTVAMESTGVYWIPLLGTTFRQIDSSP